MIYYCSALRTQEDNQTLSGVDQLAKSRPLVEGEIAARRKGELVGAGVLKLLPEALEDIAAFEVAGDKEGGDLAGVRVELIFDRREDLVERPDVQESTARVTLLDAPVLVMHLRREVPNPLRERIFRVRELRVEQCVPDKRRVVRRRERHLAVPPAAELRVPVAFFLCHRHTGGRGHGERQRRTNASLHFEELFYVGKCRANLRL